LNWIQKLLILVARKRSEAAPVPSMNHGRAAPQKYLALYKYLAARYANTVVLTFAEIEDLLGSTLPDLARRNADWWTNADLTIDRPDHADSWILAERRATPNLLARTVEFSRAS
jgi:hypothetical protein